MAGGCGQVPVIAAPTAASAVPSRSGGSSGASSATANARTGSSGNRRQERQHLVEAGRRQVGHDATDRLVPPAGLPARRDGTQRGEQPILGQVRRCPGEQVVGLGGLLEGAPRGGRHRVVTLRVGQRFIPPGEHRAAPTGKAWAVFSVQAPNRNRRSDEHRGQRADVSA
jgi:hypothetical protein